MEISLPELNIGKLLVTFDRGNDRCTSTGHYHKSDLTFIHRERTISLFEDPILTISEYEDEEAKNKKKVAIGEDEVKQALVLADQKEKIIEKCKTNEVFNVLHNLHLEKYYEPMLEDGVEVIADFVDIDIADYGLSQLEAKRFENWLQEMRILEKKDLS